MLSESCLCSIAGSHTVLALLEHGYKVTIIDNLDNSFEEAFIRMKELAGDKAENMKFIKVQGWEGRRGQAAVGAGQRGGWQLAAGTLERNSNRTRRALGAPVLCLAGRPSGP